MVNDAEKTAKTAESHKTWSTGMCLEFSRTMAGIGSRFPDASTAWRNVDNPQHNKDAPRGAFVYWTGGSKGYGHIAVSVGNGRIRSTDADGPGKVETVDIDWISRNWGLPYAGWADNVNGVKVPQPEKDDDDMQLSDPIQDWSPDDGKGPDTTVGKTLNQARGYSEDAYQRVKKLQSQVDDMEKTLNKIAKSLKIK